MTRYSYPHFDTAPGYLTERVRSAYIAKAIASGELPANAHRMAPVVSLLAPNDAAHPIQFWQLFSVLGPERIVAIVRSFYQRVFADEAWFRSVFERVGDVEHHVMTQAAMWIDAFGGGPAYHGGEFRLSFHHQHNALQLLNDRGAARWVALMVETLDDPELDLTSDPRVRPALNSFLGHFMSKYAEEFAFSDCGDFGERNAPFRRRLNFLRLSSDDIEALSEAELIAEFETRGVDVSQFEGKDALVAHALRL